MFKKINNYVLLQHPQLWNTRFVPSVILLLSLHVLFYMLGYFNPDVLEIIKKSYNYFEEYVFFFAGLACVLFIVLWLVFYLRNNAYKLYYPLTKHYFFKEFFLLFILFFLSITFIYSYKTGFRANIRSISTDINLAKEVDVLNLSNALLPYKEESRDEYTAYNYTIRSTCDSVNYKDSLATAHTALQEKRNYQGTASNEEARINALIQQFETNARKDREYKYTNYCASIFTLDNTIEQKYNRTIHNTINRLLYNNNIDSVKHIFDKFEKNCIRFKIDKNINAPKETPFVFKNKDYTISEYYKHYRLYDVPKTDKYICINELENVYRNIESARLNKIDYAEIVAFLYAAFAMTVLLLIYRFGGRKNWLLSVIAGAIIAFSFGFIMIMCNVSENCIIYYFILLLALFIAYKYQKKQHHKMWATIWLNNVTICIASILPMIVAFIEIKIRKKYYNNNYYLISKNEFIQFTNTHSILLLFANLLVVCFITVLIFKYLYKTLHSSAEE